MHFGIRGAREVADNPRSASGTENVRLLYLIHEPWPTFRNDVAVLFGKSLPKLGLRSDLVTDRGEGDETWRGGRALLFRAPRWRALWHLSKVWHNMRALVAAKPADYDAIQVRDMPVSALLGLAAARLKGLAFFYWMSFPKSESHVLRARSRGPRAGLRYWFPLLQGHLGCWLLYRIVLPRADHVFVQSRRMLENLAERGVPVEAMTPVPMGVDTDAATAEAVPPAEDPRLANKRVAVYLGTLDRERGIELLLETLALARKEEPELLLVLAGDTKDTAHRAWLKQTAERLGVSDAVVWTGWLPTFDAWRYVRAAEVGLSPCPRGDLLDVGSPTKAVEYMALGIPVVCNDNPDQAQVIGESGAGLCVNLSAAAFSAALLELLADPTRRRTMSEAGRAYVSRTRSYDQLAQQAANAYRRVLKADGDRKTVSVTK